MKRTAALFPDFAVLIGRDLKIPRFRTAKEVWEQELIEKNPRDRKPPVVAESHPKCREKTSASAATPPVSVAMQTALSLIEFRKNIFRQAVAADRGAELREEFEFVVGHRLLGNAQPVGDLLVLPAAHE
jgi:hypothetical protein